jgi:hypothetical protein
VKISDYVAYPEPGQRAEGDFERTGPIDANRVGVLALPVRPLGQDLVAETGLRQCDKVLVAVQLPDDFVVADLIEVEEGDLVPRFARGALAMDGVEVPVDGGSEIEVLIA